MSSGMDADEYRAPKAGDPCDRCESTNTYTMPMDDYWELVCSDCRCGT